MRYVTAAVAILACPCHLPIWLALLSGTALAGAISDHMGVAVVALTVLFIASAWTAVRLFSGERRNSHPSRVTHEAIHDSHAAHRLGRWRPADDGARRVRQRTFLAPALSRARRNGPGESCLEFWRDAVDHTQVSPRRSTDRGRMLELPLTLVALLCAAITPNVFVAGGAGIASMSTLTKYVLAPAIVIEIAILLYARRAGYVRLFNRLVTGLWVGAVATTGLDIVRQPGTFFGYLAHDEARMAGEMILMAEAHGPGHDAAGPEDKQPAHGSAPTDKHAAGDVHAGAKGEHGESKEHAPDAPSGHGSSGEMHAQPAHGGGSKHSGVTLADFIGYAYHYWNGASFAVVYALVFGRTPWWGPLLYAVLFIDTGMMVFMRVAMGPLTWSIGLVALFAHVVFGLILGVLFARFIRDDASILELASTPTLRTA